MSSITGRLTSSPVAARVAPFAVFLLLTFAQDFLGESARYWLYLTKCIVGAWMLWAVRRVVTEMRWTMSWEAVLAGVVVFVFWVGLDAVVPNQKELWVKFGLSKPPAEPAPAWNPFVQFGDGSALGWFFVMARILGSSFVVPPLEEVFYRSFLYRWIVGANFESVRLGHFGWKPFLITAVIFGFAHNEWLAGILCAAVYQGLVCWKNRLGDAITAHAITNLLLGIWIVWKGAWNFW